MKNCLLLLACLLPSLSFAEPVLPLSTLFESEKSASEIAGSLTSVTGVPTTIYEIDPETDELIGVTSATSDGQDIDIEFDLPGRIPIYLEGQASVNVLGTGSAGGNIYLGPVVLGASKFIGATCIDCEKPKDILGGTTTGTELRAGMGLARNGIAYVYYRRNNGRSGFNTKTGNSVGAAYSPNICSESQAVAKQCSPLFMTFSGGLTKNTFSNGLKDHAFHGGVEFGVRLGKGTKGMPGSKPKKK